MDFIEQLPTSSGFTAILVVVDRLLKQVLFIPTHDTITSPELTQLFLLHVFSKHGIPTHITSDHGTEFVSHFFHSLGKSARARKYAVDLESLHEFLRIEMAQSWRPSFCQS